MTSPYAYPPDAPLSTGRRRPRPWIIALIGAIAAMLVAGAIIGYVGRAAANEFAALKGRVAAFKQLNQQSTMPGSVASMPFDAAVAAINTDVQGFWTKEFAASGKTYTPARLSVFQNHVTTGCGAAEAASGPFYCSADQTVYLGRDFFQQLTTRFDAPGDFAEAYVLAHELGHHVQDLLGTAGAVDAFNSQHPQLANAATIRLELQADCFAGVWGAGAKAQGQLEPGDLQEALRAASAVGDDTLQKRATGMVRPDLFTHGTSAQRVTWFTRGFDTGDPTRCDTFESHDL